MSIINILLVVIIGKLIVLVYGRVWSFPDPVGVYKKRLSLRRMGVWYIQYRHYFA